MKNAATSKYRKKIITIPNVLSLCRILMIPFIAWRYCAKQDYLGTVILLTISGFTDIVDGYIARRFDMISDFGKAFDPVADKLTQAVVLFCLVSRFKFMIIPFVILVIKEILAAITGMISIKRSGEVHGAVWHGKATTVLLYAMMAIHIVWYEIPFAVSCILIIACTAMMIISAVLYSMRNINVIRKN